VSISLGERLEESACYRILGQIYTARGEKEKARENFEKSLNIFEEIKTKYELAKTYLEVGKSNSFEYFERLKYLGIAEDIFNNLESKYHLALIDKALAQLFFENQEYEQAGIFLKDAEKVFKELKEKKDLKLVHEFKGKLEKFSAEIELSEPEKRYTFSNIITQNKEMLEILEKAKQIKDTDMTVLIEGETGTGKDLLAKCIHYESKRREKNFIMVNCPTIPESLVESELFGYKKGAFSGANCDKRGWVEEADGGTLFLNEIGELPLPVQAKLLQFIEDKEFSRLGETKLRKFNLRLIAATNRNLASELKSGQFRKDLYYRLNNIHFRLSPLRERKEDIPLLMGHFIEIYSGQKEEELIRRDLDSFIDHDWPGNVRELENEITRLIVENNGNPKDASHKLNGLLLLNRLHKDCDKGETSSDKKGIPFHEKMAEYEKELVLKALKESGGAKAYAAKILNIPLTTLLSKIKKYNLTYPS